MLLSLVCVVLAIGGCATSTSTESGGGTGGEASTETDTTDESPNRINCWKLRRRANAEAESDSSDLALRATGPVAVVDGHTLSADAFNRTVRQSKIVDPLARQDAELPSALAAKLRASLKKKAVTNTVEKFLIARMLHRAGIRPRADRLERRFRHTKQLETADGKTTWEEYLKSEGHTELQLRASLCRQIQWETYLERNYETEVDDERVQAYYDNHQSDFRKPAQCSGRLIFLKTFGEDDEKRQELRERARDIVEQIQTEGVTFSEVAADHPTGTADDDGSFDELRCERFPDKVREKFSKTGTGTLIGPVILKRRGIYIVRLDTRRPPELVPLEEVEDRIRRELKKQKKNHPRETVIQNLWRKADIELNVDNVESTVD